LYCPAFPQGVLRSSFILADCIAVKRIGEDLSEVGVVAIFEAGPVKYVQPGDAPFPRPTINHNETLPATDNNSQVQAVFTGDSFRRDFQGVFV